MTDTAWLLYSMVKPSIRKEAKLVLSISEEVKKVSYLGAAGPYLLLGDQAKTAVGASESVGLVCHDSSGGPRLDGARRKNGEPR